MIVILNNNEFPKQDCFTWVGSEFLNVILKGSQESRSAEVALAGRNCCVVKRAGSEKPRHFPGKTGKTRPEGSVFMHQ
jgi:hypothetical protein